MNKTARRILPTTLTLATGLAAGALLIAPLSAANAEPATHAAKMSTVAVASAQTADNGVLQAKLAYLDAVKKAAVKAATPAAPSTTADVSIGDTTGRIWYKKISDRKLWVDGTDTGWIARYDIQVRRADGKTIFDENLSVYRLAWFVNKFDADKTYASDADLVSALKSASNVNEVDARAAFKKSIGSLGEFKTSGGDTQQPYDFTKHPGVKYIPLNYKG
jgi:hypothetical protein